jgi:hypothetical protein
MNLVLESGPPAPEAAVRFVLNALWQAPLVVAIAACAAYWLRRAPGRQIHAIWTWAALAAVLLPATSVVPWAVVKPPPSPPDVEMLSAYGGPGVEWGLPVPPAVAWGIVAVAVAASLCRAAWVMRGVVRAYRLPRGPEVPHPAVADQVAVRVSCAVDGPVTFGVLRPVVLLPPWLTGEDLVAAALAHEMAHIRRRDYLRVLVLETLLLPLAFHPAAVWLRRKLEDSRELAADEMAASLVGGRSYARSLIAIAAQPSPRLAPALGVTDGEILGTRIERLLLRGIRPARASLAIALLAMATLSALAGFVRLGAASGPAEEIRTRPIMNRNAQRPWMVTPPPPPPPPPPPQPR